MQRNALGYLEGCFVLFRFMLTPSALKNDKYETLHRSSSKRNKIVPQKFNKVKPLEREVFKFCLSLFIAMGLIKNSIHYTIFSWFDA